MDELMYLHNTHFNLCLFAGFATSRRGEGGSASRGEWIPPWYWHLVTATAVVGSFPTGMNAGFICCLFTGFISCFQPFSNWVYLESEFPVAAAEKGRPNVNAEQHLSMQTWLHVQLYAGVRPEWCRYPGRKFAGKLCIFLIIHAHEFLKLGYILDGVWYPICSILSNYYYGANLNWRR